MSANPSRNEVEFNDLDLNSDAVPLEEQNEIPTVRFSESSVTVSVSQDETLIDTPSFEGGMNEARVCDYRENPTEPFVQYAGVRVERNSGEVPVHVVLVKEGLERETQFGDGGGRIDASMSHDVGVLEDEVLLEVDCSSEIAKSSVEEAPVNVESEVVVMDNEEVPNPPDEILEADALNKDSVVGLDNSLVTESVSKEDAEAFLPMSNRDCREGDSSMKFEKQEAAQVAETVSDRVHRNESMGSKVQVAGGCDSSKSDKQNMGIHVSEPASSHEVGNQTMEVEVKTEAEGGSCKQCENQIMIDHVSEGGFSISVAEVTDISQASVPCAESQGEADSDSALVSKSTQPLPGGNQIAKVEVTGDCAFPLREKQNWGIHVSEPACSHEVENQTLEVELELQSAGGSCKPDENQIMLDCVSEVAVPNPVAEATDGSQAAVSCATLQGEAEADSGQVSESAQHLPSGNQDRDQDAGDCASSPPDNTDVYVYELASSHGLENQTMGVEVETYAAGTLCKPDENQILDHASEVGISSSVVEVTDGSEAATACVAAQGKSEAYNARASESVRHLPGGNKDSEVQVVKDCASPLLDLQNMGFHFSEPPTSYGMVNHTMEVEVETQAAAGSGKQVENQTVLAHVPEMGVSQLIMGEYNVDSVVVDLDTCPGSIGQKTGELVVEEVKSLSDESHIKGPKLKQMGGDVGFSLSDCLDGNEEDDAIRVGLDGHQNIEVAEQVTDIEKLKNKEKQTIKQEAFVNEYRVRDCLRLKKEGEFSVSDLVWGKVRSHPWWPGQIFDPSDSSEKAMKYRKKNCFLVAYFGDKTFAWNEASQLRHFQTHFSQMEKQTNLEVFRNAVNCALDEVSRRVEFGLACHCMPEDDYARIRSQIIENTGIREESNRRDGVDKSVSVSSFEPDKLYEYIKALALSPFGVGDRLELLIARAQLVAFNRTKGYSRLPEFQLCGRLLENDADDSFLVEEKHSKEVFEHPTPVSNDEEQVPGMDKKKEEQVPGEKEKLKSRVISSRKRKHLSEDNVYPSKKERSMSELMAAEKASSYSANGKRESDWKATNKSVSQTSGKKRKAVDSISDDSAVQYRKKSHSASGITGTESFKINRSFKVGECIRRVANQLTGATPIFKCSGERFQRGAVKVDRIGKKFGVGDSASPHTPEESQRKRRVNPMKYSSPDEMFSQLCLAARDPMKGYSFLTIVVSFFSDYRNSISLEKSGSRKYKKSVEKMGGGKPSRRSRKLSNSNTSSTETYMFDDVNDSYWTDRIIQSSPEEQPSNRNQEGKGESYLGTPEENDMTTDKLEYSLQFSPTLDSEQQNFDDYHDLATERPAAKLDVKQEEDFSPTALILNFSETDSVPSETNLNKIFSRFGPLKESETEILRKTSRARVVFKRRADAEAAFSSAGKYSIFGPSLVSYELRYLPSTPSKASCRATKKAIEDASSFEGDTP